MKWTFKIFFIIVLLNGFVSFSQTESTPSVLSLEGQVAVTTDDKAIFVNVGGPAIKLGFSKIAFAINMFPSLKIEVENRKTPVFPLLGVGPQIYFLKNKKFVVSFPIYYNAAKNTWLPTAGLGYVFTKPKS